MKFCTFCKPDRNDAYYRSQWRKDLKIQLACKEHIDLIEDGNKPVPTEKHVDDGYMSEGDYASWGRL